MKTSTAAAPAASGTQRYAWAWPIALVAVALALYARALDYPFLSDDVALITDNPSVAQPSIAALAGLWTTDYWQGVDPQGRVHSLGDDHGLYRPLTILSYWLESRLGGVGPRGFRLVNLLLHVAAAWLVGLWCGAWIGPVAGVVASATVLLHPTATDVVNRVVGRADILVLLAVSGFLVTQRAAQRTFWSWPRVLAAAACAALALGAKESGAIVLPLAAVQAWLGGMRAAGRTTDSGRASGFGRARDPVRRDSEPTQRHAWRVVLALGIVLTLYLAGRSVAVSPLSYERVPWDLMRNPLAGTSLAARLPAVGTLVLGYLRLLLVPWPLFAFDLPARLPGWSDPRAGLGLVALALIAAAAAVAIARRHVLGLALACWLASFVVVGQLVLAIGTYREVRLAYGMLGALALTAGWLAERASRAPAPARRAALAAGVAAAITCAILVAQRNPDFRSTVTLLEADDRLRPDDPSTLVRLGGLYERAGRYADAGRTLARAVELAPQSSQAAYELALWYQHRGHRDAARRLYERALALYPEHPIVLVALGTLALDADDLDTAARLLTRAAELAPDDLFAAYNLAVLDERRGDRDAAIARLEQLVARHPEYGQAVQALATLRQLRGERATSPGNVGR